MINNKVYQDIYDELSQYLPDEWEKMIVYLEYGNASYSFSFYIKIKDRYVKCYDLPNVSDNKLSDSFAIIDDIISSERRKEKNELWSNMTMTVSKSGIMHSDFDYTDLSDGTYQFKKNWKKKYLV